MGAWHNSATQWHKQCRVSNHDSDWAQVARNSGKKGKKTTCNNSAESSTLSVEVNCKSKGEKRKRI